MIEQTGDKVEQHVPTGENKGTEVRFSQSEIKQAHAVMESCKGACKSEYLPKVRMGDEEKDFWSFASEDVKPIFDKNLSKWDQDGDKKLDLDEIQTAGEEATDEERSCLSVLEEFLPGLDRDKDEAISQDEIDAFDRDQNTYHETADRKKEVLASLSERFEELDEDKDGRLGQSEIRAGAGNSIFSAEQRQALEDLYNPEVYAYVIEVSDDEGRYATGNGVSQADLEGAHIILAAVAQSESGLSTVPAGVEHLFGRINGD